MSDQTASSASLVESITRLICWFGAYPYASFTQLATPESRVRVFANGVAVVLSPLVLTVAISANGARLVGDSPYLLLLPVVVFFIEWLLIAMSYSGRRSVSLALIRLVILCVSLCLAVLSAVTSESSNLLQRLHRAEDRITAESAAAQSIAARQEAVEKAISANAKALAGRQAVEAERLEASRLHDMECFGRAGLDPKSGIFIRGGNKCGENARTHAINAEAATATLAKLDAVEKQTRELEALRESLEHEYAALVVSQRSPANSVGTLMRALGEADAGLLLKVFAVFAIVITIECAALALSGVPVPESLQRGVEVSHELDGIRLAAARDAFKARVARERAAERARTADGLAPLDVTVTSSTPARTDAPARPSTQPQREEVEA